MDFGKSSNVNPFLSPQQKEPSALSINPFISSQNTFEGTSTSKTNDIASASIFQQHQNNEQKPGEISFPLEKNVEIPQINAFITVSKSITFSNPTTNVFTNKDNKKPEQSSSSESHAKLSWNQQQPLKENPFLIQSQPGGKFHFCFKILIA